MFEGLFQIFEELKTLVLVLKVAASSVGYEPPLLSEKSRFLVPPVVDYPQWMGAGIKICLYFSYPLWCDMPLIYLMWRAKMVCWFLVLFPEEIFCYSCRLDCPWEKVSSGISCTPSWRCISPSFFKFFLSVHKLWVSVSPHSVNTYFFFNFSWYLRISKIYMN